ncbi:TPA: hypothetical protein U0431_002119, partial [Streptococcus suis]|nr:hypothetical protein [Streptococcus suis]
MNKRMRKKATKKSNKKQIVLAVLNASMLMAPALAPVLAPSVLVAAEEITTNTDAYKGIVNDITKEPYEVKVQQLTDTTPVVTGFNLAIYDATTNTTVYKRYESLMNMSLIVQEYKTSPQNFLTAEQFKAQHPLKDNDTLYLLTKQDIEEAPQPTELSFPNLHHREHIVYDPMTKQYYYFLAADTIITDLNYRPGLIDSNSLVTQFRGVSFMKSATLDPNLLISHTADKPTKHGLHDMGNMYDIEVEEQPDFTDWAPDEEGIVKNYGLTKTIRWRYVQKNEQGEVVFREANWRETTVHIGYNKSDAGDLIAKQPYEDYPYTGRGGQSRTAKVVYNDFATYKVNGMDFSKLPAPIRDELFASELSVPGTRGELPKDKDAAFDPTFKAGYNGNYYEGTGQVDGAVIKYDGYMVNPYRPTTVDPGAGPIKLDPKQTFPEQIYDDRGYPFTEELFKAGSIKVAQDKTVSRVYRENVNVAEQSHSIAGITGDDFALISGRLGEMQATTSGYWDYAIASVPRTEIASDATKLNLTVIEANVKDTAGSVYADYIALDEQGNVTETKLQETKTIVDKQPKDTDYALNTDNNKPDTFEHNGKTYKLVYSTLKVNDQDATYSDTGKVVKGNINATHYYAPIQEKIIEEDLTATLRVQYYDWDTKLPFPQVPENGFVHKSGVVGKAQYKQKYYIDQNKQRVEVSKEKIGNVITQGVPYNLVEEQNKDPKVTYDFLMPIIDGLKWEGMRTTDNPDTSGDDLTLNLLHEKTEFVNVPAALNGEFYTDAVVKFYYNMDWKYDSGNKEPRESEERGTLIIRYVDEDGKEIATPYTHTDNEVVGRTTYEVAVIDEYEDETSETPIASNPVENVRYNEEYTSENVSYNIETDKKAGSTDPVKPDTIGDYTFIGSDAAIPLSGSVPRGTNIITLVYKKNEQTPPTPTPDPVTYTVTHRFEKADSVPADVNLPTGLLERITEEKNYTNVPEGEEKTPNSEIATTTYTEPDTGRTWKFVGWKQDKLAPSAQTPNPEFVGVWELVYKVTHEFQKATSVPETINLPEEIKSKIESSHNYTEVSDGTTKEPNSTIDKSDFVDEVNDGTWTFANWDKNSVTINDADEQFIGYWNFTPNKYKITHEFKVADGVTQELPEAIKSRITEESNLTDLLNGSDNKPNPAISTDEYVDETNDGTWTFTGWDKDNHVINKANGHFVGTWTFTPKTYNVTHTFVKAESVPEDIELPEAIKSKIESSHNYTGVVNGDSRTPNSDINTDRYEDADNDGVWTFNRWQQDSVTVEKADAELVGEWNFTPNPKGTVKIVYKALDKNGAVDDKVTLRNEVVDTPSSPVDTPWNAAEQEKDEKPETLTHEATNTVYHLVKTAVVVPGVDGESTQTEGTVVAGETVVTYYYAPEQVEEDVIEEKGNVTVKYETESGKTLKSDYKDSENVLVSSTPTTRRYYLKDGNKVYLDEQPVRGTTTKTDATYDTREDKS